MRPVLVAIPSRALFVAALVLAAAALARDLLHRPQDGRSSLASRVTSTPLYLLGAALVLLRVKSGSWVPSAEALAGAWTPVPIYSYGVMLGTSLILGWFVAMRFAKEDGIGHEDAASVYMWTAVWSIVGARLLYFIVNHREFDSPLEIVMVNRGGLVAYGGMIGGFLASWYGCRKRGIPLLQWADASAPSVVLGTGITRIGCLLFGCDYGRRTDLPWALAFPRDSPAWKHHVFDYDLSKIAEHSYPVHPTQIYEMLAGFSLFGLLLFIRRHRRFSGQVFLGWVLGYGLLRPLIEILRDDTQRGSVGPLSTSQLIGVVAVVCGSVLLAYLLKRHREDPDSLRLWERGAPAEVSPGTAAASGARPRRRKRR